MDSKIKINAVLNVIKQALSIIFPLVTYPYALRMLQVDSIGKVSYSQSIVGYFALLAMLGIHSYAVREGAKVRNNKIEVTQLANELFSISVISTVVSLLILALCVCLIPGLREYGGIITILSLGIVATTFSVDWINVIFEDFKIITLRSIITHIVSMGLLFLLVKSPKDYYLYAIVLISSNVITCVMNWFYCRRYIALKFVITPNMKRHIVPILIIFGNAIAISIYVNLDTTMLGIVKGDHTVGLYSASVKIYTIIKSILVAIYQVSIPRLAELNEKGDYSGYRKLFSRITGGVVLLLVPTSVGLLAMAREIIVLVGGVSYISSTMSLSILSISLLFAIFGGLMTSCINMTLGREKVSLQATIIAALINFLLNLVMIPLWSLNGAAITTLIAEMVVFVYSYVKLTNKETYIDRKSIISTLIRVAIASALMLICIIGIKIIIVTTIMRLLIIIPVSVVIYGVFLLALREPVAIQFMKKIKSKALGNKQGADL